MSDELKRTVRIQRPKVTTDDRGRTVWEGEVETAELDLVTTQMLQQILDSDDEDRKAKVRKAAAGKDGVLAHDSERDRFEIVSDDDLGDILKSDAARADLAKPSDIILEPLADLADSDDELSLVSTQALRRILNPGAEDDEDSPDEFVDESGFDPYNSG